MMTTREAAQAARKVFATGTVDVHGWQLESVLTEAGLYIPAAATADADDMRTQGNLAKWLRCNAKEVV